MSSVIDRAADLLFPAEGAQTLNIKFLGVGVETTTAEDLAEQIVRAESQIREGSARRIDKLGD